MATGGSSPLNSVLNSLKDNYGIASRYLKDPNNRGKVAEYIASGVFLVGCGADVVVMLREGKERTVPRLLKTVAEGALAVALLYDAIKR